jgi:hypothetical protein
VSVRETTYRKVAYGPPQLSPLSAFTSRASLRDVLDALTGMIPRPQLQGRADALAVYGLWLPIEFITGLTESFESLATSCSSRAVFVSIGTTVTPPLVAWLMGYVGWRAPS